MSLRGKRTASCLLLLQLLLSLSAAGQAGAVKIDCHPTGGATKERCESLGCVWSPVKKSGPYRNLHEHLADFEPPIALENDAEVDERSRVDEPWCFYPENYVGYRVLDQTHDEIKLQRVRPSVLVDDIQNVVVRLTPYDGGRLLQIKVLDADRARFVPELPRLSLESAVEQEKTTGKSKIEFEVLKGSHPDNLEMNDNEPHRLVIKRSNGVTVFSTDLTKLIYSDKFIQLNSKLSSPFVYGLGEHYDNFLKLADTYKTYSFYNTDRLTLPGGTRSYGGFPFFVNLDSPNASMAHGIYLRNSNAMDIVLQNDLSVTFRPIGGILEFYLFIGPTPLDVVKQYQQLVGLPELPPRWSLGFHLCRYNYNTLARTREIWQRTRDAGIPFDVQWNDIDYMERGNDFTYDKRRYKDLTKFVKELHRLNMHYMLIFDPGVSQEDNYFPYTLGEQMDIWVKNATNQTLVGKVWNQSGRTVFPDFSNPQSRKYWSELFQLFHKEVNFDGAWIDMNDISNFVDGSLDGCPSQGAPIEHPPYSPGGYNLQTKSLCLSARHHAGIEYDVHNLYSFYETIATRAALKAARPNMRSLIISRSTHPGQGHYGSHWSGDVLSTWDYLRWSIPSLLEHSMYGFSLVGSDICGFVGDTTESLCARWSTLGAFYTFSRNHNDDKSRDQDPVALGPLVVSANRNAFSKRYSLLPYLYTLIHKAHTLGEPVARSMIFEFFDQYDKQAHKSEDQFMWGRAVLISPIVKEHATSKLTYLPEGRWYELDITPEYLSMDVDTVKVPMVVNSLPSHTNKWHQTKDVALDNLVLFYRGGHIIPVYHHVNKTVPETVRQPMGLEVALCSKERARGDLILDDGDSLDTKRNYAKMHVQNGKLDIELECDDYAKEMEFGAVKVYGLTIMVSNVKVVKPNGSETLPYKQKEHMLMFDLEGMKLTKNRPLLITWS